MSERPILFSAEMVRAILDGEKTQTRRVVCDRNSSGSFRVSQLDLARAWADGAKLKSYLRADVATALEYAPDSIIERLYCRNEPGDRLWVRETWWGNRPGGPNPEPENFKYRATDPDHSINGRSDWRSGIIMPRRASRITLELTGVRVERVQDVSTNDIGCEGINLSNNAMGARNEYRALWDALNAKRGYGWTTNPWVWVLKFTRVDSPRSPLTTETET